jgi:DNA invertase Pin-like site-specific DNA recombinase
MNIAYIRSDKQFDTAGEQLKNINAYAIVNNIKVDDEFIDYSSQNKLLSQRPQVSEYFQSKNGVNLLVSDVWVLSTNIQDLVQMFRCLLKHEIKVHFIKQSVIMTQETGGMLALGLIDQLRQQLEEESQKSIGRPKGSKSNSKFDKYVSEILHYLQEKKNVSEIARILKVSRSSLKDYIDSRELKQVALKSLVHKTFKDAENDVINTVACPTPIMEKN